MAGLFSGGSAAAGRYQPVASSEDEDGHHHNNNTRHAEPEQQHGIPKRSSPFSLPRDAADELLRKKSGDYGRVVVTPEDDERVVGQIDRVLLPIMLTVYFLQVADKTTLSYSSVFGLIEDVGLEGDQYGWLGSVVYVAQLIMQPPLAWLLVRLPIAKFTSAIVLLWGTSLCLMAATRNFHSMMVARFCLGAFEAGIGPSFVAITAMWWKRGEQTTRTSYWYAMNGVAGTLGSLITWGIGHIQSSLRPYQLIFLFFGVITVVFSFVMFAYMPDSPVEAKFLHGNDKLVAIERLRVNQMGTVSREWRNDHLKEAFFDLKTWLWFSLSLCVSIPAGGLGTFGPLIISTFGFDKFQTTLFSMPCGVILCISILLGSRLANKWKKKGLIIMCLCCPAIFGLGVLLSLTHDAEHQVPLLAAYYVMSAYPGITPLIYSWAAQNTAGDTKSKCNNAVVFLGQSLGNIIGPLLYNPTEAPAYTRGLVSNLLFFFAIVGLTMATTVHLHRLNKRHARTRVAMGKSAVIVDTSLDSAKDAVAHAAAVAAAAKRHPSVMGPVGGDGDDVDDEALWAAEAGEDRGELIEDRQRVGDRAFEDLTDLQNEEFIYVL